MRALSPIGQGGKHWGRRMFSSGHPMSEMMMNNYSVLMFILARFSRCLISFIACQEEED